MGLITKTVKVKWNKKNRDWYESKGYIFTKTSDVFEIKVEDLIEGSHILVEVKCDCEDCKKTYEKFIEYRFYKSAVKQDGKYYCKSCNYKISNLNKNLKSFLKESIPMEQWCIENYRQDVLDRWDYELNNCKPSEIFKNTEKEYYFKCPKGIHKSELKCIRGIIKSKKFNCKQCNSFAQWGIDNIGEDFLDKYWDYENNNELGIDPWVISYGNHDKVWIKCQDEIKSKYHESYIISCKSFTIGGSRCPYCSNRKLHKLDSLGATNSKILEIWSDLNEKSAFEYSPNSGKEVYWKCPNGKHKEYIRTINYSSKCDFECPECIKERSESILQEKVRLYLESLNDSKYTILHEHKCTIRASNPNKKHTTNNTLPYDNEIKELKLIIEVHGEQHYKITGFHMLHSNRNNTTPQEDLEYQQYKDQYKKDYVLSQGYHYLEIPYWMDNEQEEWKLLIDNKLNEIIKNKKKEGTIMSVKLTDLNPYVQWCAEQLIAICKQHGITIRVTQTFRDKATQDALYASGRTKKGKIVTKVKYPRSWHCWHNAFDICVLINGKVTWDDKYYYQVAEFSKQIPHLEAGALWEGFKDTPHYQVTMGVDIDDVIAGKKIPFPSVPTNKPSTPTPQPKPQPQKPTNTTTQFPYKAITSSKVNLRTSPEIKEDNIYCELKANYPVNVYSIVNKEWALVNKENPQYINIKYLKKI